MRLLSYNLSYQTVQKDIKKVYKTTMVVNSENIQVDNMIEKLYCPMFFRMYDDCETVELYY